MIKKAITLNKPKKKTEKVLYIEDILSKEELKKLEQAEKDFAEGRVYDAEEVFKSLYEEFGIR